MESTPTLGCRGGKGWTTAQSRNLGQFTCRSKSPGEDTASSGDTQAEGRNPGFSLLPTLSSLANTSLLADPRWRSQDLQPTGLSECSKAEWGHAGRQDQAQIAAMSVSMIHSELLKHRDLISLAFVTIAPSTK